MILDKHGKPIKDQALKQEHSPKKNSLNLKRFVKILGILGIPSIIVTIFIFYHNWSKEDYKLSKDFKISLLDIDITKKDIIPIIYLFPAEKLYTEQEDLSKLKTGIGELPLIIKNEFGSAMKNVDVFFCTAYEYLFPDDKLLRSDKFLHPNRLITESYIKQTKAKFGYDTTSLFNNRSEFLDNKNKRHIVKYHYESVSPGMETDQLTQYFWLMPFKHNNGVLEKYNKGDCMAQINIELGYTFDDYSVKQEKGYAPMTIALNILNFESINDFCDFCTKKKGFFSYSEGNEFYIMNIEYIWIESLMSLEPTINKQLFKAKVGKNNKKISIYDNSNKKIQEIKL